MEINVVCPHCRLPILIMSNEINATVFRHGSLKESGEQIDPYTSNDICKQLSKNNKIYGCGKSFTLVHRGSVDFSAEKCYYN